MIVDPDKEKTRKDYGDETGGMGKEEKNLAPSDALTPHRRGRGAGTERPLIMAGGLAARNGKRGRRAEPIIEAPT